MDTHPAHNLAARVARTGAPPRSPTTGAARRGDGGRRVGSGRRARRGVSFVYATMTLTLTVGFAAFCFDLSRYRSAKGELQAIADAAALNAANGLANSTHAAKAQAVAAENRVDGVAASIAAGNVTPGFWSGTAFTPNGMPRNAVRVVAARTKAGGNAIQSLLAVGLGWQAPDLVATSTVALVDQSPYEWAAVNSLDLAASNSSFKVTGYDATNTALPETLSTVKSNGTVTISGPAQVNADVRYGTSANVTGATVNGTVAQLAKASTYPPGTQAANQTGTPVFSTTYDLNVSTNQTLGGGTYVVKNVNVSNCNITFTGPATIICSGNMNWTNAGVTTHGNLPANLKIICTAPNTTLAVTNPTLPMNVDFYAPDTAMTFSAANGYKGLRGRGVFKSLSASGAGASLWYDRSLTANSMARKAIVVE